MTIINACVLAGAGDADVRTWLRTYCAITIVDTPQTADLVVFTGGSDVSPSLYGEENVASGTDLQRDLHEQEIFEDCVRLGIPMFGICRGSQFLHVKMGGKLWQDVDSHCCIHPLLDMDTGDTVTETTSTHHQMVRRAWTNGLDAMDNGFELFATPDERRSSFYTCADGTMTFDDPYVAYLGIVEAREGIEEVEGYRYETVDGINIMALQGHPEWGPDEYAMWAARKLIAWYENL